MVPTDDPLIQRRYLVSFEGHRLGHIFTDVLVVGCGAAGLRSAIEASQFGEVIVATKDGLTESNSYHAQGGLAAAMDSADSPDDHVDDTLRAVQRRVPRTVRIGTAALEELLWGPTPPNLAGFETALPTPQQVLAIPGRQPDWGPRVTLRQLTIVDGVATADFSQEMRAYGGGSARVMLIYRQIEQTLKQFATVREVVIAIEGETEAVLEP